MTLISNMGAIMKNFPQTPYFSSTSCWKPIALAISLLFPLYGQAEIEIDQTPLTVGKPVPPNIWFILDDSGSMGYTRMPDTPTSTSSINVSRHTYTRNTLYYNPNVTYLPWKKADGTNYPDASFNAVSTSTHALTGTLDLNKSAHCFHELKTTSSDPNNGNNYFRYKFENNKLYRCTAIASPTDTSVVTNYGQCSNQTGCEEINSVTWGSGANSTTRTVAQEKQNFANWYHYYRTRMKMAKASVSHAFNDIGEGYRVGYTSIWDRKKFDIPVDNDDGEFTGSNRTEWYSRLLSAEASGNTPLRAALDRAGQYFSSPVAYKNSDGTDLTCRQNFTILTTDGYWNDASAATAQAKENTDGTNGPTISGPNGQSYTYTAVAPYTDGNGDTLADVAMYYWKNDLRPDATNNVPTSATNPAFWQHMRTFGVSIGLKGTLDPDTDLAALTAGKENWPKPASNSTNNIDDLWHATVNSRGQFIVANNADEFTKALQDSLSKIAAEKGRSASGAASSTTLTANSMTYFSEYVSGAWSGDVHGYELDPDTGKRATNPTKDWSASKKLPSWDQRNILFNKNGTLTPFTWANLASQQKTALASELVVNYLRGDHSNEKTNANPNGTFREREGALGDFVNSQPIYVAAPPYSEYYNNVKTPGADEYESHFIEKKNRTPMLYIGGNDGMLHGFEASLNSATAGVEKFAFIPSSVINDRLKNYSAPDYEHLYFVDGELTVAEIYLNSNWKTVLVGTLGRGGKGAFALDVTDPENISLIWEKSAEDINAMGNLLGKPIIVEVAENSDWRVLFGNGPNSSSEQAQLITISLDSSATVRVINTGEGGNNGLSSVLSWDSNKDGLFDTVYAGDLKGNVWRFDDIGSASPPSPHKLFQTKDGQPITAAPWAAVNPADINRTWVFVGTGQYFNEEDRANISTQTWYGLIDDRDVKNDEIGTLIEFDQLVQRSILETGDIDGRQVRTIEQGSALSQSSRGWFIDLNETGERMVTPNSFYGSALIGTTFIPDSTDLCQPGGRSALWGISPFTGGRLDKGLFDVNGDGVFNDTLNSVLPSVLDGLKPILVGVPPITIVSDNDKNLAVMHTDPDDSESFRPPAGAAELQSWREVYGE